jgi:AcrR family transcriptional regulator
LTGISLAGLYYYFSSKDHLLYLIQRHAFETLLDRARAALASLHDPEERLRTFVTIHLKYFIEHPNEMKVLTHEESALGEEWRREIHNIKKNYYRLGFEVVDRLRGEREVKGLNSRLSALALFGMMNWTYTWYNPKVDPDARTMAGEMSDLFLSGILGPRPGRARGNGSHRASAKTNGAHSPGRLAKENRTNASARQKAPRVSI